MRPANDERGIDVGVLTRYPIVNIKTHVDDEYKSTNGQFYKIFSRDCPEYKVDIGDRQFVHCLCNHLKSKGYGSQVSTTPNASDRRTASSRFCRVMI
jgi:hypothetical protein